MITGLSIYLLLRWFLVPDRAALIIIAVAALADTLLFVTVTCALSVEFMRG
jgi:hypothetical protein